MSAPSVETAAALRRIAERIVEAVDDESACFTSGRIPEVGFADRKALLLLELTRAARGGVDRALIEHDPDLRAALQRLRDAVERNHATIGLHLDAARRVADTLKRVIADVESDGTYAATGLVRPAPR